MKTVIILSGISGSGKTTFGKFLTGTLGTHTITGTCSADDFWIDQAGNYNFDVSRLGEAHAWCRKLFLNHIKIETELIVVDNTNTSQKEYKFYVDEAEKAGYTVFRVIIDGIHGTKSIHNVPEQALKKQSDRLIASMNK